MSAYAARLKTDMRPKLEELRELNAIDQPTPEQKTLIDSLVIELASMKAEYDRAIERSVKTVAAEDMYDGLGDPVEQARAQYDRAPNQGQGGQVQIKTLSSYLTGSHDFQHPRGGLYMVSSQAPIAALYPYTERKAAYIPGNLDNASGNVQIFGPNTPRVPHPFLELLRTVPYNDLSVPYLAPAFTNNAADVPIGQPKPESTNAGNILTVQMRTIAHWKEVPRQILRYLPGMRQIIDDELVGGVLSKAEDDILNGTGVGEMLGILPQITTTAVGADMVTAILNAMGTIGAQGGVADAILMNPADYYALIAAAYGDNKFTPIVSNNRVAGVRVVLEGSLAAGTTIVGDWNRAVALYVGEYANVQATEALGFKSNIVTIRAEMDAVVLVERQNLLVKTTSPIVAP